MRRGLAALGAIAIGIFGFLLWNGGQTPPLHAKAEAVRTTTRPTTQMTTSTLASDPLAEAFAAKGWPLPPSDVREAMLTLCDTAKSNPAALQAHLEAEPDARDMLEVAFSVLCPASMGALDAPAGPTTAPIGQPQTTDRGVRANVIAVENPTGRTYDSTFARFNEPRPWVVLDAELCAGSGRLLRTGYGFSLIDAEGREYRSYDSSMQPFEPTFGPGWFAPNECARGLVNFKMPAGVNIVRVRWEYPGAGSPLFWAV